MNTLAHKRLQQLLDLKKLKLPASPRVVRIVIEEDFDHMGEPCLNIWVLFEDDTPEREQTSEKVEPIREAIANKLERSGEIRWPYVRFLTESQYREMIDA